MNTYANLSKACLACPSVCATCSSYLVCTSCITNYYLYLGTCGTDCVIGTYKNVNVCSDCDSTCKECDILNTNCTKCYPAG